MAGVVEGFRWALLGANTEVGGLLSFSVLITVALLVSGALYFRRMERTFADVL
jgi:lipopolysaccharide transport system permease protein